MESLRSTLTLLSWNFPQHTDTDTQLTTMIAKANGELDLSQQTLKQTLSSEQLTIVIRELERNHSITSLNLSGQPINDTQAQSLADTINHRPLTKLILDQYNLTPKTQEALSPALLDDTQITPNLSEINLSNNTKSPSYIYSIQTSDEIDLRGKGITSTTIQQITDALKSNDKITRLDLRDNPIDENGIAKLYEGMAQCPAQWLIAWISIPENGEKTIHNCLTRLCTPIPSTWKGGAHAEADKYEATEQQKAFYVLSLTGMVSTTGMPYPQLRMRTLFFFNNNLA